MTCKLIAKFTFISHRIGGIVQFGCWKWIQNCRMPPSHYLSTFNVWAIVLTVLVPLCMFIWRKSKGTRAQFAHGHIPFLGNYHEWYLVWWYYSQLIFLFFLLREGHLLVMGERTFIKFVEEAWFKVGKANFETYVVGKRLLVLSDWIVVQDLLFRRPGSFRRSAAIEDWASECNLTKGLFVVEGIACCIFFFFNLICSLLFFSFTKETCGHSNETVVARLSLLFSLTLISIAYLRKIHRFCLSYTWLLKLVLP